MSWCIVKCLVLPLLTKFFLFLHIYCMYICVFFQLHRILRSSWSSASGAMPWIAGLKLLCKYIIAQLLWLNFKCTKTCIRRVIYCTIWNLHMHFVTPSKQLHFTSFGGRCKERLDSASPGYVKWDVSALDYYLYAHYQRWAQTLSPLLNQDGASSWMDSR